MATKKSTPWGSFGQKQPKKQESPASRRLDFESTLCEAVRKRLVVRLRYKSELNWRTYEPHAVFHSPTGKILAVGTQTRDDSSPLNAPEPRNFEVGLIGQISITDETFNPDPRFSSFGEDYGHGVICAVDRI